jgi:hypothetical protein
MKVTWRELFGLSVAIMLFGSGIWANLGSGSLSQNPGAWMDMPSNRSERYVPDVQEVSQQWPKESTPARGGVRSGSFASL